MLVLSRNLYEEVLIGDDTVVRVVGLQAGKVQLGIIAPDDVRVDRKEVRERCDSDEDVLVEA